MLTKIVTIGMFLVASIGNHIICETKIYKGKEALLSSQEEVVEQALNKVSWITLQAALVDILIAIVGGLVSSKLLEISIPFEIDTTWSADVAFILIGIIVVYNYSFWITLQKKNPLIKTVGPRILRFWRFAFLLVPILFVWGILGTYLEYGIRAITG